MGSFGSGSGSGRSWGFGCGLEEIVVEVPTAGDLADLSVPGELGVVTLEGPEAVGSHGKAPHLFSSVAALLHGVQVLPELTVPFLRILHQPTDQILRELHYETHLLLLQTDHTLLFSPPPPPRLRRLLISPSKPLSSVFYRIPQRYTSHRQSPFGKFSKTAPKF